MFPRCVQENASLYLTLFFLLDAITVFVIYNDLKQWFPDGQRVELNRCVWLTYNALLHTSLVNHFAERFSLKLTYMYT